MKKFDQGRPPQKGNVSKDRRKLAKHVSREKVFEISEWQLPRP